MRYYKGISFSVLPTSQPCPREWKPFLDACYRYFPSLVTHEEAEGKCKATAGALLSVLNADESTFLLRTIFRTADSNDTWLGLRRDAQTNSWKWLDGSVYSWMNWEEPGRTGSHYRCARMRTTSGYWSAADVNCTELRTYTCKFSELSYILPSLLINFSLHSQERRSYDDANSDSSN
ncbi:hypothetical protein CAPTEDRAFT_107949 [Capitella teleta]|uniref:C-type lectin domain-containing protein n=1 Tax=Capitella teleta TaxID=283909 RepID=R7TYR7_CAPTE|nr:hypothetical protein CAPTEDRAFT_107949 [Capitella teleta]|eukprot:ELT98864.1 hypothetical protein CAPTEDRAFT_107949 [Capitella teleta]